MNINNADICTQFKVAAVAKMRFDNCTKKHNDLAQCKILPITHTHRNSTVCICIDASKFQRIRSFEKSIHCFVVNEEKHMEKYNKILFKQKIPKLHKCIGSVDDKSKTSKFNQEFQKETLNIFPKYNLNTYD